MTVNRLGLPETNQRAGAPDLVPRAKAIAPRGRLPARWMASPEAHATTGTPEPTSRTPPRSPLASLDDRPFRTHRTTTPSLRPSETLPIRALAPAQGPLTGGTETRRPPTAHRPT